MTAMHRTAERLLTPGRGVLAPDEHLDRLARVLRRPEVDEKTMGEHRSLYLDNPDLAEFLSGLVVDPSSRTWDSWPEEGPVLGVRIGTDTHPGAMTSSSIGSPEMRSQLAQLHAMGARFVKWRCDADPMFDPHATAYVNTADLAQCASVSQDAQLLPVLDIAMPAQRAHSLAVGVAVTANALRSLRAELEARDVDVRAVVVRMNFVRAGSDHRDQTAPDEAAARTLDVLTEFLPSAAPGVMFMSTGLPLEAAVAHMSAVRDEAARRNWTQPLTFAFGYALIAPAWNAWRESGLPNAREVLATACRGASSSHPEPIGR